METSISLVVISPRGTGEADAGATRLGCGLCLGRFNACSRVWGLAWTPQIVVELLLLHELRFEAFLNWQTGFGSFSGVRGRQHGWHVTVRKTESKLSK